MDKLALVDSHAHLSSSAFDNDVEAVIARALEAGLSRIITVGTDLESSRKAVKQAERYAHLLATAGIHPHKVTGVQKVDIDQIGEIAVQQKVVAIGEIGLDFYRDYSPREAQLPVLQWQLDLAVELKLPVIIHCREAAGEMLPVLRRWIARHNIPNGQGRGVIHCFMGDSDTAREYLEMGFYLSLAAYIGYPSSRRAYDVIRSIPADRLLVETDCPYLSPQRYRGQRNEPAYLPFTVESLAEIRKVSMETLARETSGNAQILFGWA